MKTSIKKFLELRGDCSTVDVTRKKIRGAKHNKCWHNASGLAYENMRTYDLQSGWLVGDEFEDKGTMYLPHFWVFDKEANRHLDVTPLSDGDHQEYDYIVDLEINKKVMEISIQTSRLLLPPPLIFWPDSNFYVCEIDISGTKIIQKIKIEQLDIDLIYQIQEGFK